MIFWWARGWAPRARDRPRPPTRARHRPVRAGRGEPPSVWVVIGALRPARARRRAPWAGGVICPPRCCRRLRVAGSSASGCAARGFVRRGGRPSLGLGSRSCSTAPWLDAIGLDGPGILLRPCAPCHGGATHLHPLPLRLALASLRPAATPASARKVRCRSHAAMLQSAPQSMPQSCAVAATMPPPPRCRRRRRRQHALSRRRQRAKR